MLEGLIETNVDGAKNPNSATASDEYGQEATANNHGLGKFCHQPREKTCAQSAGSVNILLKANIACRL